MKFAIFIEQQHFTYNIQQLQLLGASTPTYLFFYNLLIHQITYIHKCMFHISHIHVHRQPYALYFQYQSNTSYTRKYVFVSLTTYYYF